MSDKVDKIVTDKIIALLEAGTIPWKKPWHTPSGQPRNMVSGKRYRGINALMTSSMVSGYIDPNWLTKKQMDKLEFELLPDQKYTPVILYNWIEKVSDSGEKKKIPFRRFYKVYNRSQIKGSENLWAKKDKPLENWEGEAANVLEGYTQRDGSRIEHGKTGAWYKPSIDLIGMPDRVYFDTPADYWSALFHEMVHSTGSKKRLNRELKGYSFDSHSYSQEELIAEMGSCFLLADLGIEKTIENSAAYIKGWLKELKDDRQFLIKGAQRAQKAFDYIKGVESYGEKEGRAQAA